MNDSQVRGRVLCSSSCWNSRRSHALNRMALLFIGIALLTLPCFAQNDSLAPRIPADVSRYLHFALSGGWKDSTGIYFDSYIQ
jgi:hypothetical protein